MTGLRMLQADDSAVTAEVLTPIDGISISEDRRQLDFIYVGGPKSGSSWLFETMRRHPGVHLPRSKTTGFFETDTPEPIEDYLTRLERATPGHIVGEIAHDAMLFANTAPRLHAAFPNVKILVFLREPGEFAASVLKWRLTHTDDANRPIEDVASWWRLQALIDYEARLAPFYRLFPREQIKVVFFDQLDHDPVGLYHEICEFIGLDTTHAPEGLDQVVNPARPPRYPALTRFIYRFGGIGRSLGLADFVEWSKHTRVLQWLLYSPRRAGTSPELAKIAAKERNRAAPMLDALERLIGRPVPADWRKY